MKATLIAIALVLSATALAAPSPILENVKLKNRQFSEQIFIAIKNKAQVRTQGAITTVSIPGLITCQSIVGVVRTEFSCTLIKGAWNYLGQEVYASGDQQALTKKLYDTLNLRVTTDSGIKFKTIELNVPDRTGGTERNLLSCIRQSKETSQMGLRDTCQLINGL